MFRYLSLVSFTDQGIRDIKESPHRATAFREHVEAAGGRVIDLYWALGDFDGVVIFEVPDEATGTALLIGLARDGFIRTRTVRLYDAGEFEQIVKKAGE